MIGKEPEWHEHNRSIDPVCPYCSQPESDAWEIDFGESMEGSAEITCSRCENVYIATREVTVDYSTLKTPTPKAES